MLEFVLVIVSVLVCQVIQALDDFMSRFGVVSLAHGWLLGYGQIYVAKMILEWGGASLGWIAVILIAIASVCVSVYKIHNTGTRWVFAFNFGLIVGIVYGGIDLVHA
jgi:hypothetical protein